MEENITATIKTKEEIKREKTALRTYLHNIIFRDNVIFCAYGIHIGLNVPPEDMVKSMNEKMKDMPFRYSKEK